MCGCVVLWECVCVVCGGTRGIKCVLGGGGVDAGHIEETTIPRRYTSNKMEMLGQVVFSI